MKHFDPPNMIQYAEKTCNFAENTVKCIKTGSKICPIVSRETFSDNWRETIYIICRTIARIETYGVLHTLFSNGIAPSP